MSAPLPTVHPCTIAPCPSHLPSRISERLIGFERSHRIARLALAARAIKRNQLANARTHLGLSVRGPIADLTAKHDGHYEYELDLEVIVYGRNYNGKKVGPYVRLLTYQPGEEIVREGDWGGNTLYIVVSGKADVLITDVDRQMKVSEIQEGMQFGEMSVLEIGTAMGDGAQLGHASALHKGQAVPAHERWHGSPAQRTDTNFVRVPPARCGSLRRAASGALMLVVILFVAAPLLELGLGLLFTNVTTLVEALAPSVKSSSGVLTLRGFLLEALVFSVVLFFGAILVGLLALGIVPRALRGLIKPDTVYPLYSFRYTAYRLIAGLCRMRFFPLLFGDSSYIVYFLRWVGWRLTPVMQTSSNFGSEVTTANPFLTSVGTGTMIADGLNVFNDDVSSTSFRVSRAAIGSQNFFGNYVNYPAGGRTGDNVLLATKVMVPIDGKIREGVGLLGSPPFEIPRSVERDSRFDHFRTGEALRRGLAAKNRFNLWTIGIFLSTRWLGVLLLVLIDLAAIEFFYDVYGHAVMASLFALSTVVAAIYYALVERCFETLGPPPPAICSIYDPRFWWVERVWKLHPINFLHLFDGTPFKNAIWRLMGVRIIGGLSGLLILAIVLDWLSNLLSFVRIANVPFYDLSLWRLVSAVASWLTVFMLFFALYRWVPTTFVRWRAAFWAAMFATISWQIATAGFAWYLTSGFGSYQLVYGSLGAVVAWLFLIYLISMITLFGAHLSAAIHLWLDRQLNEGPAPSLERKITKEPVKRR